MGGHVLHDRVVKLDPLTAEAVGGGVVDVRIGGEQIHGREIGRVVPAAAIAQADFQILHALAVLGVQKHGAGKAPDGGVQPRVHVGIVGEGFHDGFLIAHHTGLDPLRQPGTALRLAAPLLPAVLGTQLAVHVRRCVLKCVDIQRKSLLSGWIYPMAVHFSVEPFI